MRRRAVLAVVAGALGAGGCLSRSGAGGADTRSPSSSPSLPPSTTTGTPARRTTGDLSATFEVVDGHAPTDDAADARFGEGQVTVTGTMDPAGCRRPALDSVGYDAPGRLRLVVATEDRYGTVDVECGNASYDYRSRISVGNAEPTAVRVVHLRSDGDERAFTIERG